jgi:hypothetical protein
MTVPVVARFPIAHLILLVIAVALFTIYGMIGAGWISSSVPDAFLGFGLASFALSFA